jgi:vacuolar-type H+-ATPase subunit H
VRNAAIFSPATWTRDAVRFGFSQLIERLEEGDAPRDEALAEAEQSVEDAYEIAARKLFNIDVDELRGLRDRVLDLLN